MGKSRVSQKQVAAMLGIDWASVERDRQWARKRLEFVRKRKEWRHTWRQMGFTIVSCVALLIEGRVRNGNHFAPWTWVVLSVLVTVPMWVLRLEWTRWRRYVAGHVAEELDGARER